VEDFGVLAHLSALFGLHKRSGSEPQLANVEASKQLGSSSAVVLVEVSEGGDREVRPAVSSRREHLLQSVENRHGRRSVLLRGVEIMEIYLHHDPLGDDDRRRVAAIDWPQDHPRNGGQVSVVTHQILPFSVSGSPRATHALLHLRRRIAGSSIGGMIRSILPRRYPRG